MSSTLQTPPAVQKPPFAFVFLTIFISMLGVGLLIPVLPFLVERYRPDAFTIGALSASYSVALFLSSPVFGSLSDRYGRRPILLFSMVGTAIGYFVFGLAGSLWVMFAGRILDGITGGTISTAQAYIADVSKPEDRTKNFGLIGVAVGLGFICGPGIGGLLGTWNLNAPVFFAAFLSLANAALGYFTMPESLPLDQRQEFGARNLNPFAQLLDLARDTRVNRLALGFFLFNFAFNGFTGVFAVFLRDRYHWGPKDAAGLFATIGIVIALVQGGVLRKAVPKYGEGKLAAVGLLVATIGLFAAALVNQGVLLYGTQAVLAFGVGLATPALRGMISNRITGREQGKVIGGTSGLISLTQVLGPLWASLVFDHLSQTAPLWLAAALIGVSLMVVWPDTQRDVAAA